MPDDDAEDPVFFPLYATEFEQPAQSTHKWRSSGSSLSSAVAAAGLLAVVKIIIIIIIA